MFVKGACLCAQRDSSTRPVQGDLVSNLQPELSTALKLKCLCTYETGPGHVASERLAQMQIIMWDVRKSRSGVHQLGAYGPARQPILAVISLRRALAAIPGLSSETHIPDANLYQLLLDPLDDTRAGYTLGCGWQGKSKQSVQPHQQQASKQGGIDWCIVLL